MKLTDVGESRVRGYLFMLERSLRSFLPRDVVQDALREVESHIRERVDEAQPVPDERVALEQVLQQLGSPRRVAQAYSLEMAMDEAVATGSVGAMARALWHLAGTTVGGFFGAMGLFVGYVGGVAFLAIAILKPIFPANVGIDTSEGFSLGAQFPWPEGVPVYGGYWIIPVCLVLGLGLLVLTHRGARKWLAWLSVRRAATRVPTITVSLPRDQL